MHAVPLLFASLALSAAIATPLASQPPAGVPSIGTRLKVSTRGPRPTRFVGALVRATDDSLTLRDSRGVSRTIALADAGGVEMSRGTVGHPTYGAVFGIGAGLLAGGMIGSATFSEPSDYPPECAGSYFCGRPTRESATYRGALLGALIGAGAGALIGNSIRTDRWATISTSWIKPTASVRPISNRGAVVSFALRFYRRSSSAAAIAAPTLPARWLWRSVQSRHGIANARRDRLSASTSMSDPQ